MTERHWGSAALVRQGFRVAREAARALRDALARRTPLPPVALRDVGPGDFEQVGQEFLGHLITLGSLQPSESVLEIGCGPGRMTRPLTHYLAAEGSYVGIDVVARSIAWCRRHITRRHPNFTFHHADVFNQRYNPDGGIRAEHYDFPLPDRSFDLVFLTSVFTHMLPVDIQHYLHEIHRMLRPSGRMFSTFFLLNPEQSALAEKNLNHIDFSFERGVYRIQNEEIPEAAVALEEEALRSMFEEASHVVQEPIRFGSWSGRKDGLSYQDIVVTTMRSRGLEANR